MARPLKVSDETRWAVFARGGYRCERCYGLEGLGGVSIHHRRPRMMGGSKKPELHLSANLILLCGSGVTGCHGWVESNRDKAREQGFLIYKVESASEIPFQDKNGKWWQIDDFGQKTQFDAKGNLTHG